MNKNNISILIPTRLHLSLLSMHTEGTRVNGGVGFAVESPSISVTASLSDKLIIKDMRPVGLCNKKRSILLTSLSEVVKKYELQNITVTIKENTGSIHHGFGSGTAIYLASIEALLLINSQSTSNNELIKLSGRGGTSGIGIHTYFDSGLVVDIGKKNKGEPHSPSSQATGVFDPPLLLQQTSMPDWDIGICIPHHIKALTEQEEIAFFDQTCPIPESEAHKIMYHAVAGAYAAAKEADKPTFEASIRALQECAWKKAERNEHGKPLADLEDKLYQLGATTVGMSSLGPSLFFFAKDMDTTIELMKIKLPTCEFIKTKPANTGREISYA